MGPIAIIYATREGQTRLIADRLAERLLVQGLEANVFDAALSPEVELPRYAAAVLAASVHIGKHEREMVRFVARHRADLEKIPTTFLSVSLSAAGAEGENRTPDQRAKAVAEVKRAIDAFVKQTGWQPSRIEPVAGALLYTRYGWLIRWVMKRIAKAAGGDTDTTRDYEYTDWKKLDRLAAELVARGDKVSAVGAR